MSMFCLCASHFIHLPQAAYRDNTLGLPRMLIDYCADDADEAKGTGYEQITPGDIKRFIASHYTPDRMVLVGVGVDHEQFVELAERHFVNPKTSWNSSDMTPVDGSISQYTGGHCKVSIQCRLCGCEEFSSIADIHYMRCTNNRRNHIKFVDG